MAAVIRRPTFRAGSIRLGPRCFRWGDNYTRSLSFEVERVNLAVIGGLTEPPLTRREYRWLVEALLTEGLRAAMDRTIRDCDGNPIFDAAGNPLVRRVMLPMPRFAWVA